jgi:hypothetical protein
MSTSGPATSSSTSSCWRPTSAGSASASSSAASEGVSWALSSTGTIPERTAPSTAQRSAAELPSVKATRSPTLSPAPRSAPAARRWSTSASSGPRCSTRVPTLAPRMARRSRAAGRAGLVAGSSTSSFQRLDAPGNRVQRPAPCGVDLLAPISSSQAQWGRATRRWARRSIAWSPAPSSRWSRSRDASKPRSSIGQRCADRWPRCQRIEGSAPAVRGLHDEARR